MQAVILAGGLGTRLRPITYTRPKALVPLLNRPMILHALETMPASVDEVIIAASYMVDALERFFSDRDEDRKITFVEERNPLGTGGALRNLRGTLHGPFLTLNVDVISSVNLAQLIARHATLGGIGILALWEAARPEPYGIVEVDDEGRVQRFLEKPRPDEVFSNWINAGAYVFEESLLERIPEGRPVSLEAEVFPTILSEGLYGFPFHGYWSDAGTLGQYLDATRILLDQQGSPVEGPEPQNETIPPIAIEASTEVNGGSMGPYVSVGAECTITNAHLSRCVLLDDVTVEEGASVIDSLIGTGATIEQDALVRECIVGDGASVRVGTQRVAEQVQA